MKYYISLIISFLCLISNAQDYKKMSSYVRSLSQNSQIARAKGSTLPQSVDATKVLVLIKADSEDAVGRYCVRHQDDLHICQVPVSELATLSEDARIQRIEAKQSNVSVMLDNAATNTNVSKIWDGTGLPEAFKGRGTLVGVTDVGIDYLHPTFRSTEDGRLKIVRAWDFIDIKEGQEYDEKSNFPLGVFLTNEEDILRKGSSIDAATEYHGTHTTSTAAGSGADTQYRGMAPDADIYSVCICTKDNQKLVDEKYRPLITSAMDLLMFQNIFAYADSIGKPCVINCSWGGGTQDITNEDKLYNDYLEKITGPGHIIVAAVGNEGTKSCYMPKSADTKSIGGTISFSGKDFITNISTRGKLKLHVTMYNKGEETEKTFDLDFLPGNTAEQSPSGLIWKDYTLFNNIPELDDMSIGIYTDDNGFDPTQVGYDIFLHNENMHYTYVLEIEGEDVAAEIFVQNGSLLPATYLSPTLTGTLPNSGNVNIPAAYPAVIGVGSITYTNDWTDYNGTRRTWNSGTVGRRSNFSSCGPAMHAEIKPEVMAQGSLVTAAMSSKWFASTTSRNKIVGFTTQDGMKYPWGVDGGTSMATPVVSGIIALWLEADPTLTKDKIIDVIAQTAKHSDPTLSYPNTQYGYGEIDAYKGLLYVLNMTDIPGLSTEHVKGVTVRPDGNGNIIVRMEQPSTSALPLRLFATSGTMLHTAEIPAGTTAYTIPAQDLSGIIAVQVGNLGSTLVKLQ